MLVVVVMMVVVVRVPTSPPVLLFVILLLTLGPALHGVRVGVCVGVRVGLQRGGGGQLLQGGVRGFHPDRGLAQQVDGVRQSGQNELKTLLKNQSFIIIIIIVVMASNSHSRRCTHSGSFTRTAVARSSPNPAPSSSSSKSSQACPGSAPRLLSQRRPGGVPVRCPTMWRSSSSTLSAYQKSELLPPPVREGPATEGRAAPFSHSEFYRLRMAPRHFLAFSSPPQTAPV